MCFTSAASGIPDHGSALSALVRGAPDGRLCVSAVLGSHGSCPLAGPWRGDASEGACFRFADTFEIDRAGSHLFADGRAGTVDEPDEEGDRTCLLGGEVVVDVDRVVALDSDAGVRGGDVSDVRRSVASALRDGAVRSGSSAGCANGGTGLSRLRGLLCRGCSEGRCRGAGGGGSELGGGEALVEAVGDFDASAAVGAEPPAGPEPAMVKPRKVSPTTPAKAMRVIPVERAPKCMFLAW